MSELEVEYDGQVRFEMVGAKDTALRKAELAEYELGSHGLVAFDAAGERVMTIPGHDFGKERLLEAVDAVLN